MRRQGMSEDIPYNKTFDLVPGRATEVAPGVRAVVANNPSPFTFKGTVSYIVGRGKVAIIDPGPDDDAHIAALLDAVRGETVTHIFVTHTHRDHSPAVPRIKAATGATVLRRGPASAGAAAPYRRGAAPRCLRRHGLPARSCARRRRGGQRRRLDASKALDDAGAHREPHGLRPEGSRPAVLRRSCDGVVDADRRAARRRDERLHGVAGEARAAERADLLARPRRAGARCAALRAAATSATARRARPRSCGGSPKGEADIPTLVRAIYIGLDPRLTGAAGALGAGASRGSGGARQSSRPRARRRSPALTAWPTADLWPPV